MTLVVSGPGGAGKGTVVRRLLEKDERLWLSRSWTTRAVRPGEDADAYHFVPRDAFLAHVEAGGFLEWVSFLGEYYGTPIPEPPPGHDVVLEIDVRGARQVLARCSDVVCVLLVPPSREALEERLRTRGDPEDRVRRRIELGEREVAEGQAFAVATVVNDEVDRAAEELAAIIATARRAATEGGSARAEP